MKFLRVILVLISLYITTIKATTIFERTFRTLHKEPPPPISMSRATVETNWIEQKLNHFDAAENRTWKMRYMANDKFFEDGGPIFIFVGGEWEISSGYLTGGHMHDMAKEHKGYLFYTEHRYYGKSYPTRDFSNENLKYLDVKQALADLAHFIRTKKETIPGLRESKVILTGGSYSATMVTWFKRLYPDLATGCWASSAPLFAKADFYEYKEVTGQSIRLVSGDGCYIRIQKAIAELEDLIEGNRSAEVKTLLKICDNFDVSNDLDIWTLFSSISDIFAGVVQTHNDGNIQQVCKRIMSAEDDLTGVANFLLTVLNEKPCNDVTYKAATEFLSNTQLNTGNMRQWVYQTCNEYGWYQTSTSRAQPFGKYFPLELYTIWCHDVYGKKFTGEEMQRKINETNSFFGGLNPKVKNVYITHGQLDPWRAMGIQDPQQAQIIPMHAHCKDFGSISSKDTSEMKASKERIAELVREWIGTKNDDILSIKNVLKKLSIYNKN